MRPGAIKTLLQTARALALTVWCAWAHASVGLTTLPGAGGDGPVTVFYPSSAATAPLRRGSFTLDVAWQGAAVAGNGRLIVLSQGSGGSPWPQSDLAQALARAGFVVAMPEHTGDNWHDMGKVGPESWKIRPLEVSRAIYVIGRDARFAPLVDLTRAGMYGMSAGGHTALTLAGGRWSTARLLAHCEAHLADDFMACTGAATELKGNGWDGIKKTVAMVLIRWHLRGKEEWLGHTDPRIKAVVAGVPMAADFDLATLAAPTVPVGLVQAEQDHWLVPRFHSGAVIAACKTCELLASLPTGGHGALLSPLAHDEPARIQRLLADPPGFNRAEVPALYQRINHFFQQHLLP